MKKLKSNKLFIRIFILLFSVSIIVYFYIIHEKNYSFFVKLSNEDGLVEYLTAIFYLMSSLTAFLVSFTFLKQTKKIFGILYFLLALGMFFVAGEEISWGQRIFEVSTPEYFSKNNVQNEITLHNLKPISENLHKFYKLIGLYGTLAWLFFIIIKKENKIINRYFIPNWYLIGYFIPVLFFYVYHDNIMPNNNFLNFTSIEQEPAELLLSVGFFLFVLRNKIRQKQSFNLKREV